MHHIIPKHMGGSDDESNLVELTVKEHAEAHWELFRIHGNEKDRIAALALEKKIGKEEISRRTSQIGYKKMQAALKARGERWLKAHYRRISKLGNEANKRNGTGFHDPKNGAKGRIAALSPEARAKRKETMRRTGFSKGKKNSQYGSFWITNGTENAKSFGDIPKGWQRGRIIAR